MRNRATKLSAISTAVKGIGGRLPLVDAESAYISPAFTYTRSGPTIWCLQSDGMLKGFPSGVIPREWRDGRWGFRFDPSYTNSFRNGVVVAGLTMSQSTIMGAAGRPMNKATVVDGTFSYAQIGGASTLAFSATSGQSVDLSFQGYVARSTGPMNLGLNVVSAITTGTGLNATYSGFKISKDGAVFGNFIAEGVTELQPPKIEEVLPGVWKFSWLIRYTQGATIRDNSRMYLEIVDSNGFSNNVTGDGVSAVYWELCQHTISSYHQPIAETTNLPATVGGASCSAPFSALNLSLQTSPYSLGVDYTPLSNLIDKVVFGVSSGAFNDSIYVLPRNPVGGHSVAVISNGSPQLDGASGGTSVGNAGERIRVALRMVANNSRIAVNGVLGVLDTTCAAPVGLNTCKIGSAPWGGNSSDFPGLVHSAWILQGEGMLESQLVSNTKLSPTDVGAVVILDSKAKYLRPGMNFSRAAEVYETLGDGRVTSANNSQVPWGDDGVRLDQTWTQYVTAPKNLTSASWWKTRSTAAMTTESNPFGGGMSVLVEDTSSNSHLLQSDIITSEVGGVYTAATVLYPAGRDFAAVTFTGGGAADRGVFVDLRTGTIAGAFAAFPTAYSAKLRSDGGTEVVISESTTGAAAYAARVWICNSATGSNYQGDGISGIKVAVFNHTNTLYKVPYVMSAMTVPPFSFGSSLAALGLTLGSEYTLIVEGYALYKPAAKYPSLAALRVASNNNSTNSSEIFSVPNSGYCALVRNASVDQYAQSNFSNSLRRFALRVKVDDMRGVADATLMPSDNSGIVQPRDFLQIGTNVASDQLSGYISKVLFVPRALSDSELIAITA